MDKLLHDLVESVIPNTPPGYVRDLTVSYTGPVNIRVRYYRTPVARPLTDEYVRDWRENALRVRVVRAEHRDVVLRPRSLDLYPTNGPSEWNGDLEVA